MTPRPHHPILVAWLLLSSLGCAPTDSSDKNAALIRVGSKKFTESAILGEMVGLLAKSLELPVEHRRDFGSQVAFRALKLGGIDAYVDYTGTISHELLAGMNLVGEAEIRAALLKQGICMSRPLGFSNNYVIGMKEELAERLDIRTISDLKKHPELVIGFSNEFMDREDGWPSLRDRYRLPHSNVKGVDHDLAYRGIEQDAIQVIDLYSTDAKIRKYHLRSLTDDLHHFPDYQAVILYRSDLETRAPRFVRALSHLEGRITARGMIRMNAGVDLSRRREAVVAADFLASALAIDVKVGDTDITRRLWQSTREHLFLVGLSLAAAILIAIPLGILAAKSNNAVAQTILGSTGIIQTIPALALLVFMIPIFRQIGTVPAIVALFLYSLLPIVRNTYVGLHSIPAVLRESAEALGLSAWARLRLIELPMAARSILAGIKTSTVINIGTATLGALIGAGGYGQPILTGIRLDDVMLILQGAIPAALLALIAQGLFELVERWCVPKGLRLKPAG
ncbi:MAG: glycine betaine ABC transporter substrate-binding protein [Phycisphaerae bacterium]